MARSRAQDADRSIGARIRERRIALGMRQMQLAELIGVTYQQVHKYEKGVNRVAGARLNAIAKALGLEVSYFFPDTEDQAPAVGSWVRPRKMVELNKNFAAIRDPKVQDAICEMVRVLADRELLAGDATDDVEVPSLQASAHRLAG